ncbi:MAG TPA: flagellar assembly peptidoglycan hydrolase FlgJ, partial [Gammaproteobacteria bacterium]|nr:flagellar assembly peptidoglycan hydrolase FlgJ [Gammaproteobacteria bacterium]
MFTDNSKQLASVYTDFNGLNKLHAEATKQTDEAKRETARQFESLFLQMMIKSMRQASGKGILDSDQTEMARDMYDQQLAVSLSEKG